jgi:hypothetical protein
MLIDERTDEPLWSTPYASARTPIDAFLVVTGQPMVAVAFLDPTTIGEIGVVEFYAVETGALAGSFDAPPGRVSMTQDPRDPSRLLALKPDSYAGAAHDLSGIQAPPPALFSLHVDGAVRSIHALHDGNLPRYAWAGTQISTSQDIFMYRNGEPPPDTSPLGPLRRCSTSPVHVVPDPTSPARFIAIGESNGAQTLVRFKTTDSAFCETLLSPGSEPRFARLAIALTD